MKLATYRDGSRDGQLVVVSRDLGSAHFATGIATRLLQVLDDWNFLAPQLQDLYATLNGGKARHAFAFEPSRCLAPLPRAFRWAHATSGEAGGGGLTGFVHAAADDFLGATQPLGGMGAATPLDCRPGLALLTGELPPGSSPARACEAVRLVLLAGRWSPADALPHTPAWATVFAPVALTPDELGPPGGAVPRLRLAGHCEGQALPQGVALDADPATFGQALARLGAERGLRPGALVGLPAVGVWRTAAGGSLLMQALDAEGGSPFGAIEQHLELADPAAASNPSA